MFFQNKVRAGWMTLALALGVGNAAMAGSNKPAPTTQPYPLDVCVVSGEKLGADMGEPTIIHYDGREVRLCCSSCEKDFLKDPQKYLKILDEAAAKAATTQPAAIYVCPMHKDVKSDKPGKCPICGMELQSKKQVIQPAEAGHDHAQHADKTQ